MGIKEGCFRGMKVSFFYKSESKLHSTRKTSMDPYRELGVARGASDREIKRAFHRLALLHHPDKLPPSATPSVTLAVHPLTELIILLAFGCGLSSLWGRDSQRKQALRIAR